MADLHERLTAEVTRRLDVARAADAAKPGPWRAIATHDGLGWTGFSRIVAEETTPDGGKTSRFVADKIYDSLEVQESSFADPEPAPAVVAVFAALHDPADSIRRYERALRVLERHVPDAEVWCSCGKRMCGCGEHVSWPCDEIADMVIEYGLEATDG